jgi:hypothetical protein
MIVSCIYRMPCAIPHSSNSSSKMHVTENRSDDFLVSFYSILHRIYTEYEIALTWSQRFMSDEFRLPEFHTVEP